ncbi:hypothetical protein ACF0H5_005867 [Mactra antiquata]
MGFNESKMENCTFHSLSPWKYGQTYWSSFEFYPEWTGRSFYAFKGVAHHQREFLTQRMVVVKTFKHKTGTSDCWQHYKMRSEVARKMSLEFNKFLESNFCRVRITFLRPVEAEMDKRSFVTNILCYFKKFKKRFEQGEVVLFEDLLEEKLNSYVTSDGNSTPDGAVLDAFCHYTYHASHGNLVVCNLKGNYEKGRFTLTNPTVHSVARCHGDYDNGIHGIKTFFENHICNALCENFLQFECRSPSAPSVCADDATHSNLRDDSGEDVVPAFPPRYSAIYPDGPASSVLT